jgi:hypothetical protein
VSVHFLVLVLTLDDDTTKGRVLREGARDDMERAAQRVPGSVMASKDVVKSAALHVMTLERLAQLSGGEAPKRPQLYPCGCSRHKVDLGRCDSYEPGEWP